MKCGQCLKFLKLFTEIELKEINKLEKLEEIRDEFKDVTPILYKEEVEVIVVFVV